jgi:predicted XRE-type DNA-binding protein
MKIISIIKRRESAKEKKQVQVILKDIEKNTRNKKTMGSVTPSSGASPMEKMKYSIARDLVMFKKLSGISQTEMAGLIGVDKSRITEILHYRIFKFSLDTLIQYLFRLEGRVREIDERIAEISHSLMGRIAG